MELSQIVQQAEHLYGDLTLGAVRAWKAQDPARRAIGFLPTYVPRELLHAAGALPVGILGADERLEIVRGDACFQSYICHLPRSVMELGLSGRLDVLDGMIFPSTCDVIRNLSGIWKLSFPERLSFYLDVPQNFDPAVGGRFYRGVLEELLDAVVALTGRRPTDEDLRASIRAYNHNRRLVLALHDLRAREPWRIPASEGYLVLRAGMVLPVEEHSALLESYLAAVQRAPRRALDNARVLLTGAFCEQPPLTLLRTLERAGCDLVGDDFMLVLRWLGDRVPEEGDPLEALVQAYISDPAEVSCRYVPDGRSKGSELVATARELGAEGVIFAAPSFCDPALLDRPMLQEALLGAGLGFTSLEYSENSGQMQPIREQAGTFADTIKLWGEA
jgi:benzoyl-CoA reductase subunit C